MSADKRERDTRRCDECGKTSNVIATLEATKKLPERKLCVPCWKAGQ